MAWALEHVLNPVNWVTRVPVRPYHLAEMFPIYLGIMMLLDW